MMKEGGHTGSESAFAPLNAIFAGNFLYPHGMAGTKRVQHFIDSFVAIEGSSAHVLLLRQGHAGRDERFLEGKHRGVSYVTIGHDIRMNWKLPWKLARYLWDGCRLLRKWHKSGTIENVLFIYGEPNLENIVFVLFARLLGYKVVFDVVEDSYQIGRNAQLASRLKAWTVELFRRRVYWFADAMIVISTHLKKKFECAGRGRFMVELIPISVDLDRVSSAKGRFHVPIRVFYAGSFAEKDGVESLIDAFEIVASKCEKIELLLTGRGSEKRMRIIFQKINASPFKENIHYMGYLPDRDYFAAVSDCDIPCVVRAASKFAERGFPFKLGEYLASGRPVIASAVGDVPDFIVNGESGYLIEAGDTGAVAQTIAYLVANEEEALRVGRAGRVVAEENFDAVKNGSRFVDVLQGLGR